MNGNAAKPTHEMRCSCRKDMQITGVKEVLSFDESCVILLSDCGEMSVEGSEMRITVLDTERGEVSLCGQVDAIYYRDTEMRERRSLFGRRSR